MTEDLNPRQEELIGVARELGRDRFAPRAAEFDREAAFPFANYDDLREAGFLGLVIPERFGGMGADFQTYAMVSSRNRPLVRGDGTDLQHAHRDDDVEWVAGR